MKKSFLFALASVALLSSCSQDETLSPNSPSNDGLVEIKIGVSHKNELSTRGTGTVGDSTVVGNFWNGQDVNICMFDKGTINYAKENGVALFDHTTTVITPSGFQSGEAPRSDNEVKYYPTQGEFDFWGFHLDDAYDGSEPTIVDNGDGTESLVVDFTIDGTQDIMVAKAAPDTMALKEKYTEDGELNEEEFNTTLNRVYSAYAARRDIQPTLSFKHLLTRLTFQIKGGDASVCEGENEIYVDSIKVKSLTSGKLIIAYTGEEAKNQISFNEDTEQVLVLMQRAGDNKNENLVDLEPVCPKVSEENGPEWTSVGEALLVAPTTEEGYALEVNLRQKVVVKRYVNEDGETIEEREDKPYSYTATITNKKNDLNPNAAFEAGKSYNVKLTIWGLSEIKITTELQKWEFGGNIDLPIEDEGFAKN